MKQQDFERQYAPLWKSFSDWLESRQPDSVAANAGALSPRDVPQVYRKICHHLALCRSRNYSPRLEEKLNLLALAGHRHLYASSAGAMSGFMRFFAHDFPVSVRKDWVYVLIMIVAFYGPALALIAAIYVNPPIAYSVLSPQTASGIEEMYDPDSERIGTRDAGDDFLMFGYYVLNNISIGFRTFAGGLIAGLGALYIVLQNGVFIGAVFGHLSVNGYGVTLWPFVAGHGSLELNAIVLAGAAGLKLGWCVIAPGRRRRMEALRVTAHDTMPIVYGFTAMLLGAAFIEAFWSSTHWAPPTVKYAVAAILWLAVIGYFVFAGRARGS